MTSQVKATSLVPLSLQRITDIAEVIIHARVSAQQVELDQHSQQIVTITHFEVIESIKGDVGSSHSIKQLGGSLAGSNQQLRIHGVPRFVDGEELIVFLPAPSRLGFSSPVGLSQGNFSIDRSGETAVVRNRTAADFRLLGKNATGTKVKRSKQSVAEFKQQIRDMSGATR